LDADFLAQILLRLEVLDRRQRLDGPDRVCWRIS